MFAAALKLVGVDLQRQWVRLKSEAEEFKNRTTDDIKHKAVNAGLAIGLAFIGLMFAVVTIIAGLAALYLWVGTEYGRFAGLGAVAATTAVVAIVLFIVAASRAKAEKPSRPAVPLTAPPVSSAADSAARSSFSPVTGVAFVDSLAQDLTDRTAAAANEALDAAAGIVRKSPREAILATLAVAVVAGIMVGRRR